MTEDLDAELAALTGAVRCRRCHTLWPQHNAGGPVTLRVGGFSSPAAAVPVTCPGFMWVDPAGAPVGSYSDPPER